MKNSTEVDAYCLSRLGCYYTDSGLHHHEMNVDYIDQGKMELKNNFAVDVDFVASTRDAPAQMIITIREELRGLFARLSIFKYHKV